MRRSTIALTLAALTLAGCVKEQVVGVGGAGIGPSLVLEQFLRAANTQAAGLETMARLFGTKEGSAFAKWPRTEWEPRMFAIARELKHQDFEVLSEQLVPGRSTEATKLIVRIKINDVSHNVPFTFVRYKQGWLIEQIGLEVITRPSN